MNRKWRWVSRDGADERVEVWQQEEHPQDAYGSGPFSELWQRPTNDSEFVSVCHAEFLQLFGIDVKPGECLKVEFEGRVV